MKKQNLIYLVIMVLALTRCQKEETEANYAANPIRYTINNVSGSYVSQDKIALLWWDGTSEKVGLYNTNTDNIVTIGTVGDLQIWQGQSIVKDDTLYTFGFNANDSLNNGSDSQILKLYRNDVKTGALISKTSMPYDLTNLTIAGRHNNEIILLWWNGSSQQFGVLDTNSDTIVTIGTVGDIEWWQQQCIIKDDILYTFGTAANANDSSNTGSDIRNTILYKNDLNTGTLISNTVMPSGMDNITIAGRYNDEILLLWWDGTSEKFGVLNATSNTISPIGVVGDLQLWQGLCFVNENTLYTFGLDGIDNTNQKLYKNDLKTGSLISKSNHNTNLINLTISKNK